MFEIFSPSDLRLFLNSYGAVTITGEGLNLFYLCSAHMAIEQWGSFSVPHILWHGASVYNGHLRRPVTLTLMPSIWQWSCHYLFLRIRFVAAGIRTSNFRHATSFVIYLETGHSWSVITFFCSPSASHSHWVNTN